MKVIIVTGTPGVGKTIFSKQLAKENEYLYANITDIVKKNKLYDSFDKIKDSLIVDEDKLVEFMINFIKKSKTKLVIDGHMSHYIPSKYVQICYVLKCDISILNKRLAKRKYSKNKIKENIESEIFDICLNEAIEFKHNVKVINSTY